MSHYIFLSSLRQTPSTWIPILKEADIPGTVHCPDLNALLGGLDPTFDNLYSVVSNYCRKFYGRIHLCGESAGALLALRYAARHPDRAASLVLVSVPASLSDAWITRQQTRYRLLPKYRLSKSSMDRTDILTFLDSLYKEDMSRELDRVVVPTLILCGQKDKDLVEETLALHEKMPGSFVQNVPDASWDIPKDNPAYLSQVLHNFYKDLQKHPEYLKMLDCPDRNTSSKQER